MALSNLSLGKTFITLLL